MGDSPLVQGYKDTGKDSMRERGREGGGLEQGRGGQGGGVRKGSNMSHDEKYTVPCIGDKAFRFQSGLRSVTSRSTIVSLERKIRGEFFLVHCFW